MFASVSHSNLELLSNFLICRRTSTRSIDGDLFFVVLTGRTRCDACC